MAAQVLAVFFEHCRPASQSGDLVPEFHTFTVGSADCHERTRVVYLARPWPRPARRLRRAAPSRQPLDAGGWHRLSAWHADWQQRSEDPQDAEDFDRDGVYQGTHVHEVLLRLGSAPLYAPMRPRVCYRLSDDADEYVQRCRQAGPPPFGLQVVSVRHRSDAAVLSAAACGLSVESLLVEYDDLADAVGGVQRDVWGRPCARSLYELRYTVTPPSADSPEVTYGPFPEPCVFGRADLAFEAGRQLSRLQETLATPGSLQVARSRWRVLTYRPAAPGASPFPGRPAARPRSDSATSSDTDTDTESWEPSDTSDDDDDSANEPAETAPPRHCRSAPVSPPLRRLRQRHHCTPPLSQSWPPREDGPSTE